MREPWAAVPGGLKLSVRLTPRGGRDGLDGVETLADGRAVLRLRVSAAPSDGAANAALLALLARLLGTSRSRLALVSGASARLKTVQVDGEAEVLVERLRTLLAAKG